MGKNTEGCVVPMEAVETILRKSHHGEFDQSGSEKQMSTNTEVITGNQFL